MKAKELAGLTFIFVFLCISQHVFSQVSEGGEPFSYSNLLHAEDMVSEKMPFVDVEKLKAEDEKNKGQNIPFRFGKTFEVNYSLANSGKWDSLANGDRIWKLTLESKGAHSINLTFGKYVLPEGAKLFIFNKEKTMHIGAFTSSNNQEDQQFGTRPVKGSTVTVEYYEPKKVAGKGQVVVSQITHGYRNIFFNEAYGYGTSESCQVNINCPDGAGWQDHKRSVVLILVGGGLCSGALVNNALQDGKPYVLTAYHCYSGSVSTWVYVFNYESAACSPTTEGPTNNFVSGSTYKAGGAASDFLLVELNSRPPLSYNVYYSGWSKSSTIPSSSIGIHHPSGDVKKISTKSSAITIGGWNASTTMNHWRITGWTKGSTEGGSSGSPLFDTNKRIIGQLHGGSSTYCPGTTKSSSYGALFYSWNTGTTAATRLRDWLDPGNTGVTAINGGYIGNPPCSSPPSAGTSVSSRSAVCIGNSFNLSLSGTSTGTGLTYQWQSSATGTSWSNISGATLSGYSSTQLTATYYRCRVTCSGTNAFSSSVLVNMTTTACGYIVPVTGSNTITTCSGYIYDNGGSASNYADDSDGTLTIRPSVTGNRVQLAFTSFLLESCCDYLMIYDGTSILAPLLGKYTSTSPGTINANNPSGALTLRFYSDGSVVKSGFAATISCITASPLITVPISGTNSINACSGIVYDHAGESNYSNNANGVLTIHPSMVGNKIQLAFTSFALESCCDYLRIYDGTSVSAPLIGQYNSTSPGTLTATNASGALTLRFYSDGSTTNSGFAAAISCINISGFFTVPFSGSNSITTCSGTVYDHAGASNYTDDANGVLTINPSIAGNKIQLDFTSFSLESCCDYLSIYDGTSISSPLIEEYSANPGTVTATNASGALTLKFYSDISINYSGFSANISCLASGTQADLLINSPSASPITIAAGNTLSISCSIQNQSPVSSPSSNVGYYLSLNNIWDPAPVDTYLGFSTGGVLAANSSSSKSATLTIPSGTLPGSYYVLFVADYSGLVSEMNEANNVNSFLINVGAPTIDLIIQAPAISSSTINSGNTIVASCLVNNQGNSTSSSSNVGYYLSTNTSFDGSDVLLGSSSGLGLGGGTSSSKAASLTIPGSTAAGTYYILFYADNANAVSESNESNNIQYLTLTVSNPTLQPDLIISSFAISAPSANPNGTIDVSCSVYNQGGVSASLSSVGYFLSSNTSWDPSDVYLGYTYGGQLTSFESATKAADELVIPENTVPGNYYIIFYADFNGDVSEANEVNNTAYFAIAILNPSGISLPLGGLCNIFPNPTQGQFTINLKGVHSTDKASITVYNTLGVPVEKRTEIIMNGSLVSRVDLTDYSSGVYLVKVELDTHQTMLKVVVE